MVDNVVSSLAIGTELLVGSACHLDDLLFGVAGGLFAFLLKPESRALVHLL